MEYSFGARLKHAWNAFLNRDPTSEMKQEYGASSYTRPDRPKLRQGSERSLIASIYTRIAIDVSGTSFCHARIDDNGRYLETIKSGLNNCLTCEANVDQTARAFMLDVALSLLDEGSIAIVPVDTSINPIKTGSYDIQSMRTAKIINWYPNAVRLSVYNEKTGQKEEVTLPKKLVAIVENPFYSVMNERNSTLQRLIHKLSLLDSVDEAASSGKLDMIIKLPYSVKSDLRKTQAEKRRQDIEEQLTNTKYGIAYIDSTEEITQLGHSVDNQLLEQIEFLTKQLYSQLGLTEAIFDGTADDATLTNYYARTVEPIISAIADEMRRKFLTKTARSQGQSIFFFKDPFKFVPVSMIAQIADLFTRNEIMTSNEIRQLVGMKAVDNPRADELLNKNMPYGYNQDPNSYGYEDEEGSYNENDNQEVEGHGEINENSQNGIEE